MRWWAKTLHLKTPNDVSCPGRAKVCSSFPTNPPAVYLLITILRLGFVSKFYFYRAVIFNNRAVNCKTVYMPYALMVALKWTSDEERKYKSELKRLYEVENKTISQISILLGIAEQTVFQRLQRLKIPTHPEKKSGYLNYRKEIFLPHIRSAKLAEFFGVMLGDGHVSHFQTIITLGNKEIAYVEYVCSLIEDLFSVRPKVGVRSTG